MKAIVNGRILLPDAEVQGKALLFDRRIIGVVDPETAGQADEVIDAAGAYVAPGLVDVHIHGYMGADVSDADNEGVRRIARGILKNGVTSFLPTTMTIAWDTLETIFAQLRELREETRTDDFDGAEILGCHAEGPFINPSKKGAQNGEYILKPDAGKVLPYKDIIKMMTFAPEMEGAEAFLREIRANSDITLSIGHTGCNYDTAMNAVRQGATHFTHTFNAMTALHHRDPGTVGAALTADEAYCELIGDTFHVHKGLFPLFVKTKGDHLVIITDALRTCGMPEGVYELGGQQVYYRNGECRLEDGTIAGSVLCLNKGVKNLRDNASLPMYAAVAAASRNAAASIGMENVKGSLKPGCDADIILMDNDCNVSAAYIRGVKKL